ncbi:exported hypothetical protein [Candidatus Sulfopaludibacter sp. SbA3]|nr:exported hypothetical protein [Candidatus Sulfopaludibacter sp. SbA3]
MRLKLSAILLFAGLCAAADSQQFEFAMGRASYTEGQFKKAAAHFQLALKTKPDNAEIFYWIGMSYQMLADVAAPFGSKYNSQARAYLTKATELAPAETEYRRELFNLLLEAGSSRAARRQAEEILRTMSESDPEYVRMHRQFQQEHRANSSAESRLGWLFLAGPRAAYRIAESSSCMHTLSIPPADVSERLK